jgi:hypothetical protein
MDWFLKILELCGLNQKRTSPHEHQRYFNQVGVFEEKRVLVKAGLSQWGIFLRKPHTWQRSAGDPALSFNLLKQRAFS